MPYCLGLHIEDNLIKYAKVQIEKDSQPKVGTHGIVFYDNVDMAIEQIISETTSYGVDIATNLSSEMYDYTEVFSGIRSNDLSKHLKLYFQEEVCPKRKVNPSSFQSRYILGKKKFDDDNIEVIYISANKTDINKKSQLLKRKIKKLLPVSLANLSLLDLNENSNLAVLNIDSASSVTIVLQGKVKKIVNINVGMSNILSALNKKYGSYAKSYKECKSITLYNENVKELVSDVDTEDVSKVTSLLDDVGGRLSSILSEYAGIINTVYITGLGLAINNIDLYFEEMLNGTKVEILKPSFIANNIELSSKIKDFTEVNSAIALAISSGKIDDENFNFVSSNKVSDLTSVISQNKFISNIKSKLVKNKDKEPTIKQDRERPALNLAISNATILQTTLTLLLIFILYAGVTIYVNNTYKRNTNAINEEMENIKNTIQTVEADRRTILSNRQKYDELQLKIQKLMEEMNQVNGITYDVPNLLTSIALVTPDEVVIKEIKISTDKKVSIDAKCSTYSPLGFFISELKNNQIMLDIKTELVQQSGEEESTGQEIIITGDIL